MLDSVTATRYVAPLREGGSLPGLVEADDDGIYVCKFRGAGQGLPVLVAEVIVGELARCLGLDTPRLVAVELPDAIARYEADEEVQDLLTASLGLNLGVDFLPGSFGVDTTTEVEADWAARVLWLDAFVANVDRSWRNPNLLLWHRRPWLIDHGACLYFHHGWAAAIGDPARFGVQPWDPTDHVLGRFLVGVPGVDAEMALALDDETLRRVVDLVPEPWLAFAAASPDEVREAYVTHLAARRDRGRPWLPGRSGR